MSVMKKTYENFSTYDVKYVHRTVESADYSDDVSAEQLKYLEEDVAAFLKEEEWTVVAGPAW